MAVSLTELRQKLFKLADHVVDTGEPLIVERRGVRLRLVRDMPRNLKGGRLSRLKRQELVIGPPLDPHESPAEWSGEPLADMAVLEAHIAQLRKRRKRKP
jgi:hypothetical protein